MLDRITPVILTYNEAPNIGRTLAQLSWARDIVIVDSFSTDETLEIVAQFPQARIFQRQFDTHCNQWNFALQQTAISSEWVLALDADYQVTPELLAELRVLEPASDVVGYDARFLYCINGSPIKGSAYPPVTVLYRRAGAGYVQDGHTQRLKLAGVIQHLRSPILHDDRKPLVHWIESQRRYMKLEAEKLLQSGAGELSWADRLRKTRVLAPFAVLFYCLFVKGAILNGRAGVYYAYQRMFSELLLSLYLIERDLNLRLVRQPAIQLNENNRQPAISNQPSAISNQHTGS